jgi:hypothetical protein
VCYEGQLLVETFKVKVTNSDGTTGSLDMQATGTVTTGDPEIPPKSCSCCFFQMVMLRYPMVLSWGYIIYIYICNGNIDGILMDIPSGVIKYGKLGNHPAEKSSINVVRWLGTVEGCTEIGAKKSMATY